MKTALITGVSRGIGKALAEKFLREGYFVVGTSTKGGINWSNKNLNVFPLQLNEPSSIEKCAKELHSFGRKFDVYINNAGMFVNEEEEITLVDIQYLRRTLEVNLIGTIDFTERMLDLLNPGAHLVNISSRAGSLGFEGYRAHYPAYRISKAALNMFTRVLSKRLMGSVTVSSVHPGWVKTDMGGQEADIEPQEAAEDIYKLATSAVETGQFWFKGERFPW